MQPGVSVAQLARENNINDNLLFNWRRLYQQGLLAARTDAPVMLPVTLAAESGPGQPHPPSVQSDDAPCCELVLPAGTLRISGKLTPELLQMLIREMQGVRGDITSCRFPHLAGCRHHRHAQRLQWSGFQVQNTLRDDPFSGHLFIFRGRRGDMIKVLWADRDGLCMFTKRLERGRFVWPVTRDGKIHLTPAQLSMLLEGINWKHPQRTERPGIRI